MFFNITFHKSTVMMDKYQWWNHVKVSIISNNETKKEKIIVKTFLDTNVDRLVEK